MKTTARHTALQALLQMEENEGYSNIVIDKALRGAGLDSRGLRACFCHFLRCLGTPAAFGSLPSRLLERSEKEIGSPLVDDPSLCCLSDPLFGPCARLRSGQ